MNRCRAILFLAALCLESTLSFRAQAEDASRQATPLTGEWLVQPGTSPDAAPDDAAWGRMPVDAYLPSLISGVSVPFDGARYGQGTPWQGRKAASIHSVWYQKALDIPSVWKGQRVLLDFRRIEGDAIVFLNGQRVAELLRPGGEVDLTPWIDWDGPNLLRVFVTRDYAGISRNFEADPLRYFTRKQTATPIPMEKWGLGLSAPVTLSVRPLEAITDVFCQTSWRQKKLTLTVETDASQALKGCRLQARVLDADGREALGIQGSEFTLEPGRHEHDIAASWPKPVTWELDRPYLYRVEVTLTRDGKTLDAFPPVTFGFREVWVDGRTIMMNGHPSRWRVCDLYSAAPNTISLYQLMGFNVGQRQPAPGLWWRSWAETPWIDPELLATMDRKGFGVLMPAPSVSVLKGAFLREEKLREDFQRELAFYLRRYRNHPSILAWVPSMNSFIDRESISPQGLGRRVADPPEQGRVINAACEMVKQADPTRLVYGHAEGGTGEIATTNEYLNFAPLQEREEWPLQWQKDGDMPYGAVEFGPPFTGNFWKGHQFLMTEYLAIYQGEDAYRAETDQGREKLVKYSIGAPEDPNHLGSWQDVDMKDFPTYWDFQQLFARQTNRAWRTWGVPAGWMYWLIEEGFGTPPQPQPGYPQNFLYRYKFLPEPMTEKPTWANANWDIYSTANQPLLVYIAGAPLHTDKTSRYYEGETVQKQIAIVWDGGTARDLDLEWSVRDGDKVIAKGDKQVQVKPGDIRFVPVAFKAPATDRRRELRIQLRATEKGQTVAEDELDLTVFPREKHVELAAKIGLYDPMGKTGPWLQTLGVKWTAWKPGQPTAGLDLLILGREALAAGDRPFLPEEVAGGLRVLILEQQPEVWEGMGLETIETMPRYVFIRDKDSAALEGIEPSDLINWRGSPDLLPEGRWAREYNALHAPKWTNRHAVASVAIKIPETVGFTPILQTEFDLAYSPLLRWNYGKGAVYYSTLDLTGRVGNEPAAGLLAKGLLREAATPPQPTRVAFYTGGLGPRRVLDALQVALADTNASPETAPGALVIAVSGPDAIAPAQLHALAEKGATVFHLAGDAAALSQAGFSTHNAAITQAPPDPSSDLLRAVGPGLLRWRDTLDLPLFDEANSGEGVSVRAGGLLLDRAVGTGREIFCQLDPTSFAERYVNDPLRRESIQLSVARQYQLLGQILTNLRAQPTAAMAQRLSIITKPQEFRILGRWRVVGPYLATPSQGLMINHAYSAEKDAVAGGFNPNLTYARKDGGVLDWRREVDANTEGYVDLGTALEAKAPAVAYATRTIHSEKERVVRFRFGVDYWLKVWLNGQEVLTVDKAHREPAPNQFVLDLPLLQGDNVLTLKVGAGQKGFGFWADMADTTQAGQAVRPTGEAAEVEFYRPPFKFFDPYSFTYW